jgi:hypothetical protein
MFLRSVKAPNGRHEYLRLVESVREGNKVKQRVVAHLGRKDQLAPHLDTLIRLLQDQTQTPRWVAMEDVSTPRASTWGPILVAPDGGTGNPCLSVSSHSWRIVSLVPAASMLWHHGWKTILSAMPLAVAGCRSGSSPAGSR